MKGTKTTIYMSIIFGIKNSKKHEVMCQNGKIDNVVTRCTKIWICISSFSQMFTTMERRISKLVVYNPNYSKTYHLCVLYYEPSLFTVNWRELWHLQLLGRGRSKSNPNLLARVLTVELSLPVWSIKVFSSWVRTSDFPRNRRGLQPTAPLQFKVLRKTLKDCYICNLQTVMIILMMDAL